MSAYADEFRQVGSGLSVTTTITKSSENLKQHVQDLALWNEAVSFVNTIVFLNII